MSSPNNSSSNEQTVPDDGLPALRILLVDDVSVHRTLLQSGLQRLNPFLQLEVAGSVEEAREKLTGEGFDAVVCDWKMPGEGGDSLLGWMRQRPAFKYVPFIMNSTQTARQEIILAFVGLGVDDYVTKPFTPASVYEKILRAVDKKRALRK
jgi:two-component system, OmpR family, phosphate regulon response regulator PhoB